MFSGFPHSFHRNFQWVSLRNLYARAFRTVRNAQSVALSAGVRTENAMTGMQADWFTDPRTVHIVVVSIFALALLARTLAGFMVQRLLRMNRKMRSFRYRVPLTLLHPKRSRAPGIALAVPVSEEKRRNSAAVNRRAQ
jgi:hypothetical protein